MVQSVDRRADCRPSVILPTDRRSIIDFLSVTQPLPTVKESADFWSSVGRRLTDGSTDCRFQGAGVYTHDPLHESLHQTEIQNTAGSPLLITAIILVLFLLEGQSFLVFFNSTRDGAVFAKRLPPEIHSRGGTHNIFGWGCTARSWKTLPYFRPKYTIFHTLFQTWLSKCIFPTLWCVANSATLNRFTAYETCDAPNDVSFFHDRRLRQHMLL